MSQHDPGCYLFFVPATFERFQRSSISDVALRLERAVTERHRRLVVQVDANEFGQTERSSQHPDNNEFDSYIILGNGVQVPSIGAGGHVTLQHRGDVIYGTASIRPFVESNIATTWAPQQAVYDTLAPYFESVPECIADFGYYEGTWMERQEVIRPTFVFIIESESADGFAAKWVLTIPATRDSEG